MNDEGPLPTVEDPLFLTLQLPDREPETHEVTGPPGVIRFAIGTHSCRSSVWRVWTNRNTSDVYVGVRNITGVQKYSFHESGRWHLAFGDEAIASRYTGAPDRFIERWDRPENGGVGWTRALAVKVPHGALSDVPDEPHDEKVVWLPEPAEGRVAVVGIGVVEPDLGMANVHGLPIDAYRLANGHAVVVIYATEALTDATRESLTEKLTRMPVPHGVSAAGFAEQVATTNAMRVGLFGSDADSGARVVWDLPIRSITVNEPPDLRES